MLVCGAWVYWGAQTTTAMNIALIYAAAPVLIAWGSAIWLGERMSGRQMIGVALALVGAVAPVRSWYMPFRMPASTPSGMAGCV